MAGGFDEKAGGAQMGVMQGPMVSERWWDLLPLIIFNNQMVMNLLRRYALGGIKSKEKWLDRLSEGEGLFKLYLNRTLNLFRFLCCFFSASFFTSYPAGGARTTREASHGYQLWKLQDGHISNRHCSSPGEEIPMQDLNSSQMGGNKEDDQLKTCDFVASAMFFPHFLHSNPIPILNSDICWYVWD